MESVRASGEVNGVEEAASSHSRRRGVLVERVAGMMQEQQIMTRSVTVIVSYWEGFHMGGERERERKGSYPIFTWETLSAGGPRV